MTTALPLLPTPSGKEELNPELPWHTAYPAPRNSNPESISRAEVLQLLLRDHDDGKSGFVLIDLRRMDHEVGDSLFFP